MSRITILLLFLVVPGISAIDGSLIKCVDQYSVTICSNGTEITKITQKSNTSLLIINLANYTSIVPNAFVFSRQGVSLRLAFGDCSSGNPCKFTVATDSFNGFSGTLLRIDCWVGLDDTVPLNLPSGLLHLTFGGTGLMEIPKNLLRNLDTLQQITFRRHKINVITEDSLSTINKGLRVFEIGNGDLDSLQGKPFQRLSKLAGLILDGNKISDLSPGVFDGLGELQRVNLRENRLMKIRRYVFISEHIKLEQIDFSYNQIRDIESNAFSNLNLKALDLTGNKFTVFANHYLNNLKRLDVLMLRRCHQLVKIEPLAFEGIVGETWRITSNYALTELVGDTFNGLHLEKDLVLDDNNHLQKVRENAFRNLSVEVISIRGSAIEDKDISKWGLGPGVKVVF